MATLPTPTTIKEVQRFLGFVGYYRRFIQNFAEIAKPLHWQTECHAVFKWTHECQASFKELQRQMVTSPVPAYPDYSRPFILDTDASNTGIGAVLSQLVEEGRENQQ